MAAKRRLKDVFRTAAKRAVLLPLTAFFLAGCATSNLKSEPASDYLPPVTQSEPEKIKEPETPGYEQSLFEMNGNSLPPPTGRVRTELSNKQKIVLYMNAFCVKPLNTNDWGVHFKDQWSAYPDVSGLTLLGQPLSQRAIALNVSYCDLPVFPAGFGGQYLPSLDAVVLPKTGNDMRLPLVLAHEVVHAAQHKNGELDYHYNWDIESRLRHTLATEGAAFTVEFMVAFEAKLKGDNRLWEHLQTAYAPGMFSDEGIYRLIEDKYKSAILSGKTNEAALVIAASHAFHRVFDNKSWTEFYLDQTLKGYLDDITGDQIASHPIETGQYGQKRVDRAGQIGSGDSFTAGARLPTLDKVLTDHPKMKWAFEAAEIARYAKLHGKDSTVVRDMMNKATAGANPYLGLDLADVNKRASAEVITSIGKTAHRFTHEIMDQMLLEKLRMHVAPPKTDMAPPKIS